MGQTGFCKNLRFPTKICGFLRFSANFCASEIGGQNLYTDTLRRGSPTTTLKALWCICIFLLFPSFLPAEALEFSELKTPLVYTFRERKISPKFFRPKFFHGRPRGMSVPKCLFFQDLEGLTEVFGGMSAGMSGRKLPLWAEFSFLNFFPSKKSCNSQEERKSAKISEKLRIWLHLSPFSLSLSVPLDLWARTPRIPKNSK